MKSSNLHLKRGEPLSSWDVSNLAETFSFTAELVSFEEGAEPGSAAQAAQSLGWGGMQGWGRWAGVRCRVGAGLGKGPRAVSSQQCTELCRGPG